MTDSGRRPLYPPFKKLAETRLKSANRKCNLSTKAGAEYLAAEIRAAWGACGRRVAVEIEHDLIHGHMSYFPRLRTPMRGLTP